MRIVGIIFVLPLLLSSATRVRADCLLISEPRLADPFLKTAFFPNWQMAPTASFTLYECDDAVCTGMPDCPIIAMTIQNYGTATGGAAGDITDMYFQLDCDGPISGVLPMTYAGVWSGGKPTWTWNGNIPFPDDPCKPFSQDGCLCGVRLNIYTDINSCPTDGASIQLGPGFNDVLNPWWPGGIYDSCNCAAWSYNPDPTTRAIRYVMKKADKDEVQPGDTINYTLYYGKPGTVPLSDIWVLDTQPPYTHYIQNSATPAPEPGWDPDPGPPLRLMWHFGGPIPVAAGRTGQITFQVTVDWGNKEWFEPGSGDIAAPEGMFLFNNAHLSWSPDATCSSGRTSNSTSSVVRRYLFWQLGDNDLLFASRIGQPDDEMIYEVFIKNLSASKTWWNIKLWDTVPPALDVWGPGLGFNDACVGWTMTPTGCSPANPGPVLSGGNTLLTWTFDLPPGETLTMRWKARVKPTATDGDVASNASSLRAFGKTAIVDGTGDAVEPVIFVHDAAIKLRTTYISYVAWAGEATAFFNSCAQTYYINFYPLNKATNFALYKKWCCGKAPCNVGCDPFATDGGVSPSIDEAAGTCTGGPAVDWQMGCKAERIPARFIPSDWRGDSPDNPWNFLHKLVANAPVIWELATCHDGGGDDDAGTYSGTTSLSFAGRIAYTYVVVDVYPDILWILYMVNTDPNYSTTVHLFTWDPTTLSWDYVTTKDIFKESQWAYASPTSPHHFRIVSSRTPLIIHKASPYVNGGGNKYRDFGSMAPNRESGNLINNVSPSTFYVWAGHLPGTENCVIVGNVGNTDATYDVFRYQPFDPTKPQASPSITIDLVDNAGFWNYLDTHIATAGMAPGPAIAGNGHVYGDTYDRSLFLTRFKLYKVVHKDGGAIQVMTGRGLFDEYGGACVLHASLNDIGQVGAQTGQEFWLHHAYASRDLAYLIDVFSPKGNVAVNLSSNDGYTATYTTNGVDQAICWRELTTPSAGIKRNWKVKWQATGSSTNLTCQYINPQIAQKFFAAPFMQMGVFYNIIVPPVAYAGQSFWITIVVTDTGGGTKDDYCGTTNFTSTDPAAEIEGSPMDTYLYAWTADAPATCDSGGLNDNGVKVFVNVTLTQLGIQTIIASDTLDGSIVGLAAIMVVGADIKLTKEPRFQVAASGDVVQFKICWSNYSSASGSGFTVTDQVPNGFTYFQDTDASHFCGATGGFGAATVAYSTTGNNPGDYSTMPGAGVPVATWLRWTIPQVGVNTTGCVCFQATVD